MLISGTVMSSRYKPVGNNRRGSRLDWSGDHFYRVIEAVELYLPSFSPERPSGHTRAHELHPSSSSLNLTPKADPVRRGRELRL